MNFYYKILLLTLFLLLFSCSIIEEYTGTSENIDRVEEIDISEDVDISENLDDELQDNEEHIRMEKEDQMRMEKEDQMRMEKEDQMRIEKEANSLVKSINIYNDSSYKYFNKYADVETLRIFALPEVSDEYLKKVGAIYKLIFDEDNPDIDRNLKNEFFQTMKNNYVYQRVGFKGPELYDMDGENPKIDCCPGNNYEDNQTDYIWEPEGSEDPTGEIIEHSLHTITNVAFNLMSSDWDSRDSGSKLRLAYKEAVDKKLFNEESYAPLKGSNDFYQVTTQEYFFWVIITEWDLGFLWDLPNEEFLIKDKTDLSDKLPLSHQLYKEFVEKILNPPNKNLINAIINN